MCAPSTCWIGESGALGITPLRGDLDRGAHAVVRAAAADVGDRLVDLCVAGIGRRLEERRGRHDHAGLAVPALRNVERHPCFLQRMRAVGRKPFDGDDFLGDAHRRCGADATARGHAIDMHGAGSALRDAATVLGAGQSELLAQHPEQWRIGVGLEFAYRAVDVQAGHGTPFLLRGPEARHVNAATTMPPLSISRLRNELRDIDRRDAARPGAGRAPV